MWFRRVKPHDQSISSRLCKYASETETQQGYNASGGHGACTFKPQSKVSPGIFSLLLKAALQDVPD